MQLSENILATGFRHFMAVAETGSVRAAARQTNVAPSAISRQVTLLEQHLGLPLFDRNGRKLLLSPAGEILLRGLRAVNHGHEETLGQLNALRGLKRGHIRLATVESLTATVVPQMLADFFSHYPGLQVSITVAGSEAVADMVREHAADVGFTFNQTVLTGLTVDGICDLPVGAAMAPRHPLANARKLSLAQCAAYPLAWPSRGLSLRAILDHAASALGLNLTPAFECNSLRLMSALAARQGCIAFQTLIGIERELAAGELVFVPLTDSHLPPDRLMVVSRDSKAGRIAINAFLACARKHLPKPRNVRKQRTG